MKILLTLALLSLSCTSAFAGDATIQFKSGEMKFLDFLAMVSEKLDYQIDASALGGADLEMVAVPETGPLSSDRAQAVALTVLYLEGYTWIHDTKTGFYRVLRQRDARDLELPIIADEKQLPDSDLLVTYIMQLEHTDADYVARNLRSFMPANSRIIPYSAAHLVIISDSAHNISKLRKLVQRIDNPQAAQQAKAWMDAHDKQADAPCPSPLGSEGQGPKPIILIALFSLIALVMGFLARGYVIRRIEGGL